MLLPNQVKPLLLHPDYSVRAAASEYFKSCGTKDTEVTDLSLQALERFVYDQGLASHSIFNIREFPASPTTIPLLLGCLETNENSSVVRELNWAMARIPLDLWDANSEAIARCPRFEPETMKRVERRKGLLAKSGAELLIGLEEFAEENEERAYTEIDAALLEDILEALSSLRYPDSDELGGLLRDEDIMESWFQIHLVQLAGLMRKKEFVPLLVDFLGETHEEVLQEEAEVALGRIGDPSAVDLIESRYVEGGWEFKLYAGGVLATIHEERAEKVILGLLGRLRKREDRWRLCMALADQFSHAGIEILRQEVREEPRGEIHGDLENSLLTLALALDEEIPELRPLLAKRAERDRRMREYMEERSPSLLKRVLAPRASRFEEEEAELPEPEGMEVVAPISANSGPLPNAPCPCGSGKKYKKCCGRMG